MSDGAPGCPEIGRLRNVGIPTLSKQTMEWCSVRHPTPDYPLLAFSEALQRIAGAGTAMLIICSIAGAIPATAEYNTLPEGGDRIALAAAWIAHWALAGMMIWGILPAIVMAWCFHQLLHGTSGVLRVLGIAFSTQLVVSTAAMLVIESGPEWQRVVVASGGGFAVLGGCAFICRMLGTKRKNATKPRSWIG